MYRYLSEITMIVICSFVPNQPFLLYVVPFYTPSITILTRSMS